MLINICVIYVTNAVRSPGSILPSINMFPPNHKTATVVRFMISDIAGESRIITFPADLISSTLTAYLPDHHFYSCRTNQRYRVYTRTEGIPATLNDALLHYYAKSGEKVFYLLFCRSMIPFYRITPQKLASFRDFSLELLFYTDPPAFFPAGEDYFLFKVTAKE